MSRDKEDDSIRSTALKNAQSILQARQRAEQELRETKEALEEEKRILELLNQTGARLASELDLEAVVQMVTDAGTELSGAQFGAFFYNVSNEDGDSFALFTLSGAPRAAFEKFGQPRATPIFAPTFRGEGIIRVADITKDPRYGQVAPHHGMPAGHLPVKSYLAVPVVSRSGEVIGGLFFGHSSPDVFRERSERLVTGIAAQAAIAIDNARLYEQQKRAAQERARLLEAEQQARMEVERVSLMKDEFLATLSHELRTPLNAVLGWSDLLLARTSEDLELRRGLDTIARNARAQAQLIDDLLDMNRIVSGKIRLDVQRLDLAAIVEAALESVRPSMSAKELRLRATVDPHAGPVFGDPNRLQQVVWNLLSNAVKFTPRQGKLDVLLQRVNSHVEITVMDSGIGISADFLPHLFERFSQAEASTTRRFGGLGLGLAIVKQLVELHGGSIRAESPGEGQGSTFVVTLPLRAVRGFDEPPREHPTTPPRNTPSTPMADAEMLSGLTILVVDDESDARDLLQAVLSGASAEVYLAASAAEAFLLLKQHRFSAIVSDVGMPKLDGYTFMRQVRELPAAEGGRTPAIALTAFARSEDRTRAMLVGYQVHLSKPIEPRELVATLKSLTFDRG
jgi:signal transduction histidine kinase/ActR/RegA family two-component response regulator